MKLASAEVSSIVVKLGDQGIGLGNASADDIWNLQVSLFDEEGNRGDGIVSTQIARRGAVLPQCQFELTTFAAQSLPDFPDQRRLYDFYNELRGEFQPEALNGMMSALGDLYGKVIERPVYQLFDPIREVPFNVCITLTIKSKEETLKELDNILLTCPGLRILKIKEGDEPDDDKLRAIVSHLETRAQKGMKFIFDFNGAYSKKGEEPDADGAIRHIERLEKIFGKENILVIEEVINCHTPEQRQALKRVSLHFPRTRRSWHLYLDESVSSVTDLERIHDDNVPFDGVNLKLAKTGGFYGLLELATEVVKRNKRAGIGCMFELGNGIAAALHIVYPVMQVMDERVDFVDVDGDYNVTKALGGELHLLPGYKNGSRPPSSNPGLGAPLNEPLFDRMIEEGLIVKKILD